MGLPIHNSLRWVKSGTDGFQANTLSVSVPLKPGKPWGPSERIQERAVMLGPLCTFGAGWRCACRVMWNFCYIFHFIGSQLGFVVQLPLMWSHGYLCNAGKPCEGWHTFSWELVFRSRPGAKQRNYLTAPSPQSGNDLGLVLILDSSWGRLGTLRNLNKLSSLLRGHKRVKFCWNLEDRLRRLQKLTNPNWRP